VITPAAIRRWVEGFDPQGDPQAVWSRETTLALLARDEAVCSRASFDPGHVTASGLVLSTDGEAIVLVFHTRLQRWLQPGGHIEATDETVVDAARREVLEETGIAVDAGVTPVLVSVDVHEIPAARGEPAHRHHDLMFRFVAPGGDPMAGAGALRVSWANVDRLGDFGVDGPLRRAVARARTIPPGG